MTIDLTPEETLMIEQEFYSILKDLEENDPDVLTVRSILAKLQN